VIPVLERGLLDFYGIRYGGEEGDDWGKGWGSETENEDNV